VTTSSLAAQTGVPPKCVACDTAIPSGRDRCPGCGKVYGEWNRCPSCHAIAAVHEARRGSYVCAACGAPRTRQHGTPVDSQFADELWRRSLVTRAGSWALWPVGLGLFGVAAMALGLGQLFESTVAYASAFGGLLGLLGVTALVFARRLGQRAQALREQARQERVLGHITRARAAITAGEAAQALHIRAVEADAALTALAKTGRLDLDVDERGTVRYRVLTEEELRRRGLEVDEAMEREQADGAKRST
jgi:hypothetical protein